MNKSKLKSALTSKIGRLIIIGVVCFLIGVSVGNPSLGEAQQVVNLQNELEISTSKVAELQSKVDEAKPWFDLKEEERKAEEAKIAEEKAKKEAEEKAKKEEEIRLAEEKKKEEIRLAEEKKKADEEERKKAEAQKYNTGLTYDDIARNPQSNKGKYVKFSGKILQVMNGEGFVQYRMAINEDYEQVVLIEIIKSKLTGGNILEDDVITIEGMFMSEMEYTTVMGAKQSIPAIVVDNLYR